MATPALLRDPEKAQISFHLRRSRTLRSLARSSSRNGSQFAILLVNPSGEQVELYASEALRDHVGRWLGDAREEAKETVQRYQHERDVKARQGIKSDGPDKVYGPNGEMFDPGPGTDGLTDEEVGDSMQQDAPSTVPARPLGGANYDEFLPSPSRVGLAKPGGSAAPSPSALASSSRVTRSHSTTHLSPHQQPSPAPSPAAASPASALSPGGPSRGLPRSPTPLLPWRFTPESLETWYEGKFSDFNHKTDKLIAKAWIKASEPQKRTRYPYEKGEETKPSWWPTGVRHKEPDHLNKSERVALLTQLVRFSPCSTAELDASLDSVASQLAIDKLAIAREVCKVAKEERLAIKRSGTGTFESFSVTLGPIPIPQPKKEEDDSSPRLHNTRHRSRRSLGGNGTSDSLAPPTVSRNALPSPLQQTPRPSVRASPYPLSRSQSTAEMDPAFASPVRSPAMGSSAAASGMSRSQSHAGPISGAGKNRAPRQSGRHSLGEADLLDPSNTKGLSGMDYQPSMQATPYRVNGSAGGRPQITPRQGQGSPLAGASMARSYSTSALNGGGAGTTPGEVGGSASKVKASLIDDSVASPAMIKSRSRLSQQHFDSMGLGNAKAAKGGRGGPQGGAHGQQQAHLQQQLPQPHFHPHHLQQFDPQHLPQRPPLTHSHTQPLPQGHFPPSQQAHLIHPAQRGQPQQHVLVYPTGAPAPQLLRQPSSGGGAISIHPAHQLQIQQNLHAQAQHHLQQQHQHHLAASQVAAHQGQNGRGHHGPAPTQVQVQVNVHAGHALPPPSHQHQQEYEQHLPLPPQHQQHLQRHPHQQQQSGQRRASHPSQYAAYPTPQTASSFGASPSPFLAQQHQQNGGGNGSPYLNGDHAFLMSSTSTTADAALFAGSGGAPSPMVDSFFGDGHSSGYGASPAPLSAGPLDGGGGGAGGVIGPDGDLTMYVQQLEVLEAQQQQSQFSGTSGGSGFEDALGLGLGEVGMSGLEGGMGLEPGYYGEEGYGAVGA
ncbi:hypothetical protein JCM11251_002788 [Rhodosporidiobolus azoricus]